MVPNGGAAIDVGANQGFFAFALSEVADRVVFMDAGEIVEDAKKEDFFGKPRSERAQVFLSKILQH